MNRYSVRTLPWQGSALITHSEFAAELCRNGKEHVKENFLMTTNVKRWLLLFQIMLGMTKPTKPEAK